MKERKRERERDKVWSEPDLDSIKESITAEVDVGCQIFQITI